MRIHYPTYRSDDKQRRDPFALSPTVEKTAFYDACTLHCRGPTLRLPYHDQAVVFWYERIALLVLRMPSYHLRRHGDWECSNWRFAALGRNQHPAFGVIDRAVHPYSISIIRDGEIQ